MLFTTVVRKTQPYITPVIIIFSLLLSTIPVQSKTLQEVEAEIQEKKDELSSLEDSLKKAESLASYYESQKNTASSDLGSVEAELKQLEAEIKANNLKIKKVKQQLKLKKLEVQERDFLISDKLVELYISYKDGLLDTLLSDGEVSGFWKRYQYQESLLNDDIDGLTTLSKNVKNLQKKYSHLQALLVSLQTKNEELASKKTELEGQVAYLSGRVSTHQTQISQIENQIEGVKQGIEWLTKEQQEIIAQESKQISEGTGDPDPLVPGEYYFYGRGRDLYDGHGVGMSQWGAYGMAKNYGWNFKKILKYYYKNIQVSQYQVSDSISIIYCPDNPTYDTPPCSGSAAVVKRLSFEDYLTGIGEVPDSWPLEVIKAQIVAARTYAVRYTNNGNPNNPICITASCQVHYLNAERKRDAAKATKDIVLLSNGSLISAVYHASARGQTQNNEYRWTSKSWSAVSAEDLLGWPSSYLKGVDDSPYSYQNEYYNWKWRTNSYSLEELSDIFSRDAATSVGKISSIKLYRKFNRIWAIQLVGTNGTKFVAGWKFKAVFNDWIYYNYPPEKRAYLFSTELYFLKA